MKFLSFTSLCQRLRSSLTFKNNFDHGSPYPYRLSELSLAEPCPVTFITSVSNGEMIEGTITGPCPNGIVVAPVNHSLEFECSSVWR